MPNAVGALLPGFGALRRDHFDGRMYCHIIREVLEMLIRFG